MTGDSRSLALGTKARVMDGRSLTEAEAAALAAIELQSTGERGSGIFVVHSRPTSDGNYKRGWVCAWCGVFLRPWQDLHPYAPALTDVSQEEAERRVNPNDRATYVGCWRLEEWVRGQGQ